MDAKTNQASPELSEEKQIEAILEGFRHGLFAIHTLAETQLKHARENQEREVTEATSRHDEALRIVHEGTNPRDFGFAFNTWWDAKKALDVLKSFNQEAMLAETLFTSIFNNFEAYIGTLLTKLFSVRPDLLRSNRTVHFSDVLERKREDIVNEVITNEIDSLLRESYSKCFDRIAKKFNVGTLKRFSNWPVFVELSQRRNVITHSGGIVSKQYMEVCKAEGANIGGVAIGQKLTVTSEYLANAIDVVAETGIKMGQVLWRALRDSSIEPADSHLGQLLFELLKRQSWTLALRLGEFGQDCSKRQYSKPRSDRSVKIILLNHAQAAKWSGDEAKCQQIVDGVDWSGSGPEFRIAVACLKDDHERAYELMREIGMNNPNLPIFAYHGWPIFREIRTTPGFSAVFKEIFGVEFAVESQKESAEKPVDPPDVPEEPKAEE